MRNRFWPLPKDLHFQEIGWHNGKPLQKLWLTRPFPNGTRKNIPERAALQRRNCSCGLSAPMQDRWTEQQIFTPIQCLIIGVQSTDSLVWPFINTICFHQGKGDDREVANHHFSILIWKNSLCDLVNEAWQSNYTITLLKTMIEDLHITH